MIFLFFLSIFCPIFLDTNLIYVLGLGDNRTTVAYIPMIILIIIEIIRHNFRIDKICIAIILWGILGLLLKSSIDQGDVLKRYLTFFIIPFLFIGYLDRITSKERKVIQKILFIFIFTEFSLALYERLTLSIVFNYDSYQAMKEGTTWTFRASALLGHPLGNAMAISTINIFILCSNLSSKIKITSFILVIISLFCFNERGNIIISFICSLPMLFLQYKSESSKNKLKIRNIALPLLGVIIYILSTTDLGGRLFNVDHSEDASILARLEALESFSHLNQQDLFLGNPNNYNNLVDKMGLAGIENGVITILIYHGLIIGIPALILLILFQNNKLNASYPTLSKILILITFYGIGITNPHISNPYQWFIFISSYYAFRPIKKYNRQLYDKKVKSLYRM